MFSKKLSSKEIRVKRFLTKKWLIIGGGVVALALAGVLAVSAVALAKQLVAERRTPPAA